MSYFLYNDTVSTFTDSLFGLSVLLFDLILNIITVVVFEEHFLLGRGSAFVGIAEVAC